MLKALGREPMLVAAADHIDIDWEVLWRERISEQGRLTTLGWSAKMKLEALVVNIRWARAAAGWRCWWLPLVLAAGVGCWGRREGAREGGGSRAAAGNAACAGSGAM